VDRAVGLLIRGDHHPDLAVVAAVLLVADAGQGIHAVRTQHAFLHGLAVQRLAEFHRQVGQQQLIGIAGVVADLDVGDG
ncbi:hypothetical protein B8W90_13100, partial [Staphylococcus hominis]